MVDFNEIIDEIKQSVITDAAENIRHNRKVNGEEPDDEMIHCAIRNAIENYLHDIDSAEMWYIDEIMEKVREKSNE